MRKEVELAASLLEKNDSHAVERALDLLQDTVFSFSMKVCGQREDAEDTMQEVLVKSLPYLQKFESPRALLVWLYKVAKNRCLMSRRKSKFAPTRQLSLDELMPDRMELARLARQTPPTPESLAIQTQQAARLRQAIQELPANYRIILVLRDMEWLSDEEVAEITGLRPGNVRVRLHRARLFVRKKLAGEKAESARGKKNRVRPHSAASASIARPTSCKAMFSQLSNYLDEQLDDSLCEQLEQHMEGCDPCKAFLASLEATIQRLRQIPSEKLDKSIAATARDDVFRKYPALVRISRKGDQTAS